MIDGASLSFPSLLIRFASSTPAKVGAIGLIA